MSCWLCLFAVSTEKRCLKILYVPVLVVNVRWGFN